MFLRHLVKGKNFKPFNASLFYQVRNKVTLIQRDFTDDIKIKRPLPIVFVQSSQDVDKKWPTDWQNTFMNIGHRSTWIHLNNESEKSGTQKLNIWYQDLVQIMQEHSYFPPLLVANGQEAWKVCQKYVCNKPVSGLILVDKDNGDDENQEDLPSMEFEPYFPIYLICPSKKVPSFLQQCDHMNTSTHHLQHMIDWMDVHV
ncbi:hypothetical protein BJ944DRAFT_121717 [Cunninghamella echinulata]|nr:hypothetical protein BJ944DRAFT_121717 [Cunninghamella echinulata]